MNKKDVCQIICITDRSGSMQTIKQDAIGGFNAFIEEQRKLDGKAEVTLVLFDDKYEVVYKDKDIDEVDALDDKTFIPRGSTALYDAVGKSIATLNEERADKNEAVLPKKVIFAIITDGEENSSREFRRDAVMDMVKECKVKDWGFIYLCADEAGFQDGQEIFGRGSTMSFMADAGGTSKAYSKMSRCVTSYRSGEDASDHADKIAAEQVMMDAILQVGDDNETGVQS